MKKKDDKKEFINSKINIDKTIKPLISIEILKICVNDKEREKLYI